MYSLRYIEKSIRWEGNTIPLFRYDGNATIYMHVGGSLTGSTLVWGLWPRSALSGTSRFSPKPYTLNPSPETGVIDACLLAGTGPCRVFLFWGTSRVQLHPSHELCTVFFFRLLIMCRWRWCPPTHTHTHTHKHAYVRTYPLLPDSLTLRCRPMR